jgi:hypothetical protein
MHGNRIRGNTSHQNIHEKIINTILRNRTILSIQTILSIHRVAVKAKEEAARVDVRAIVKELKWMRPNKEK